MIIYAKLLKAVENQELKIERSGIGLNGHIQQQQTGTDFMNGNNEMHSYQNKIKFWCLFMGVNDGSSIEFNRMCPMDTTPFTQFSNKNTDSIKPYSIFKI